MAEVSVTLNLDDQAPEESSVSASVSTGSVDTGFMGDKDFDAEIESAMILNSAEHSIASFVSTSIERTGPTTANVIGDLTLGGITRPVTLQAEYQGSLAKHPFVDAPAIGFSASGEFDRTEFGIDFLSGQGLSDMVSVEIQTELIKQ